MAYQGANVQGAAVSPLKVGQRWGSAQHCTPVAPPPKKKKKKFDPPPVFLTVDFTINSNEIQREFQFTFFAFYKNNALYKIKCPFPSVVPHLRLLLKLDLQSRVIKPLFWPRQPSLGLLTDLCHVIMWGIDLPKFRGWPLYERSFEIALQIEMGNYHRQRW